MSKIVFVDSDLDGTFCRLLFEWFEPDTEILQSSTGGLLNTLIQNLDLSHFSTVGFADLSPSREIYDQIQAAGKTIFMWDHHETTRVKTLAGIDNNNYYYDLGRCSTRLVYDYFRDLHPDMDRDCIREAVMRVDAYDRWEDGSPLFQDGKNLNNILLRHVQENRMMSDTKGYDKFVDIQFKKFLLHDHFEFLDNELMIIAEENKKEDTKFKRIKKTISLRKDRENRLFGYFELDSKISIICSRILKEFPQLDYVLVYNLFEDNGKFSLRTRKEHIQVNTLAEKYGNGGHKQAAGLRFLPEQREFVDNLRNGTVML